MEAIDGSEELCKIASAYTGIAVKYMFFEELNEGERYDEIWACSSILHVPMMELEGVLTKMVRALKTNGIIYTSFKYGTFEGARNGRYFTDMTEDRFGGDIFLGVEDDGTVLGVPEKAASDMVRSDGANKGTNYYLVYDYLFIRFTLE